MVLCNINHSFRQKDYLKTGNEKKGRAGSVPRHCLNRIIQDYTGLTGFYTDSLSENKSRIPYFRAEHGTEPETLRVFKTLRVFGMTFCNAAGIRECSHSLHSEFLCLLMIKRLSLKFPGVMIPIFDMSYAVETSPQPHPPAPSPKERGRRLPSPSGRGF